MKTAAAREQESAAMRAKMDELAKSMPDLEKKAAEAVKAAADAKPMIDSAVAAVTAGQRAVQYWMAAKLNKDVLARRDALSTQREKLESLDAEIRALDEELKKLAAAKVATPPPAAEELAKIDKKAAEAAARLEEAKKEQTAAAPQVPELEKAIETGWQSYLAALPKDTN
jgi:chromosome segregation ATPase